MERTNYPSWVISFANALQSALKGVPVNPLQHPYDGYCLKVGEEPSILAYLTEDDTLKDHLLRITAFVGYRDDLVRAAHEALGTQPPAPRDPAWLTSLACGLQATLGDSATVRAITKDGDHTIEVLPTLEPLRYRVSATRTLDELVRAVYWDAPADSDLDLVARRAHVSLR